MSDTIKNIASTPLARRTLLGAAGLASATALVGCNSDSPGGPSGGGGVLNVWGGVPGENGPQDLCDAFTEANPGVKVNYTRYVNDDTGNLKLDSSLAGGAPIDVFISYAPAKLFQRVDNGLAIDLSDRIDQDPDLKQFGPSAETPSNYFTDGKAFSIPAQKSPTIVVLNQTMLDDAGITLGDTWTIEDYEDVMAELSHGDVFGSFDRPGKAEIVLGPDRYYADNGARSNFEHPVFAEDLQARLDAQAAKYIVDRETVLAEKLEVFKHQPFLTGRTAMNTSQIFILRYISDLTEFPHDFITKAMPHPTVEPGGDEWGVGAIGDNISISSKTADPDLAWEFVRFWMLNGSYNVPGGRLPSVVGNATPADLTAGLLGPDREEIFDVPSFENALFGKEVAIPVDTIFTAATEIETLVKQYTDEVLLGTRTVDSWVETLTKEVDAAISAAK